MRNIFVLSYFFSHKKSLGYNNTVVKSKNNFGHGYIQKIIVYYCTFFVLSKCTLNRSWCDISASRPCKCRDFLFLWKQHTTSQCARFLNVATFYIHVLCTTCAIALFIKRYVMYFIYMLGMFNCLCKIYIYQYKIFNNVICKLH